MLNGEYKHSIDGKGRLFIPVKFRSELGDTLIACKGFDECVSVYSEYEWKKFTEALDSTSLITDAYLRRYFYAGVKELSVDSQGRTVLPLDLRQKAKLDKDVTIIGMKDHFEIWDNELLEAKLSEIDPETVMARFKELGL